jgi:hypothetical protein
MNRIERVVVDECVGQESPLVGQLCERLGERPVKFVFLATEHPGIPDIEILDKLLDVRSALLTQDRVLHNLAIGRGFQSFVHTPESGLTDRPTVVLCMYQHRTDTFRSPVAPRWTATGINHPPKREPLRDVCPASYPRIN